MTAREDAIQALYSDLAELSKRLPETTALYAERLAQLRALQHEEAAILGRRLKAERSLDPIQLDDAITRADAALAQGTNVDLRQCARCAGTYPTWQGVRTPICGSCLRADRYRLRAAVQGLLEALPTCRGRWVSGSGGHAVFSQDCHHAATWGDDDDMWKACDKHAEPILRISRIEERSEANAIRAAEAALRDRP